MVDTTDLRYEIHAGEIRIIMDRENVTERIHDQEVGDNVAIIAKVAGAREAILLKTKALIDEIDQLPLVIGTGRSFRSD